MRNIKYVDLSKNFIKIKKDLFSQITEIGKRGDFILGRKVKKFENELKKFTQSKYVATCANGTDAIEISLKILGIKRGDQVITTSNTWLSVGNAIINVGATPVFVDIDQSLNIDVEKLKKKLNKKTKCIIVTHLNGLPVDLKKIIKISRFLNLKIIEDCSQAIGSKFDANHVGNHGDIATYSLHPTKNLGVFGDGGFITTKSIKIYKKFLILRNNGLTNRDLSTAIGRNSRLDNFQAIVGSLLLKDIKKRIYLRQRNANLYNNHLKKVNEITFLPKKSISKKTNHTFHRYVIQCNNRDQLLEHLIKNGIEAKVHYPINIHEQIEFKKFDQKNLEFTNYVNKRIISLPIQENLSENEIIFICKKIKNFFDEK